MVAPAIDPNAAVASATNPHPGPTPGRRRRILLGCLAVAGCLIAGGSRAHPGSGIVVDGRGRVFFIDTGAGVWRIDPGGRPEMQGGEAFHWMAMDTASRFAGVRFPQLANTDMRALGEDPTLLLSSDYPVTVGTDGGLYFAEPRADGRLEIVRLEPSRERGVLTTLPAASDEGPLRWLNGIAAGADGAIYYAENAAVRRIDARGEVTTVVSGIEVAGCDRSPGWDAELGPALRGLAVAEDGTVYAAATGCGAVLRIGAGGDVATVLQVSWPWRPTAVAVHGRELYVLEYTHDGSGEDRRDWVPRVRRLSPDGTVTLVGTVERGAPGRAAP